MNATEIVEMLINAEGPIRAAELIEASVRLPARGHIWVASYTGDEPGRQVWRSTGLTDRDQALARATQWEQEARQRRLARGKVPGKPTIRVRRRRSPSRMEPLTQREVALLLGLSERGVREIERRAFAKLRRHPALRHLWQQYQAGELGEATQRLLASEAFALLLLARTSEERQLVQKLIAIAGALRSVGG